MEDVKILVPTVIKVLDNALKSILGDGKPERLTTPELYELCLKDGNCNIAGINLQDFRIELGKAFKQNLITGFTTKLGRAGGIVRGDHAVKLAAEANKPQNDETPDTNPASNSEVVDESSSEFTLQISPTVRVVKQDERNWAIQKKSGEIWLSKYYYPTFDEVIRGLMKKIINEEFKLSGGLVLDLKGIHLFMKKLEENVFSKVNDIIVVAIKAESEQVETDAA